MIPYSGSHPCGTFAPMIMAIIVGVRDAVFEFIFVSETVISGLIPWQQIGVIQSNFILDGSVWLYNLLFATLSSLYKTVIAIFSAGIATLLNSLR